MKRVCYSFILAIFMAYGNDFDSFDESDSAGFAKTPSISEIQTSVELPRNQNVTRSVVQTELLRRANLQRNGKYIMFTISAIPTERIGGGNSVEGYAFGLGARAGIISYIDSYIGIRGYVSIDINNDKLSPIAAQRLYHSGTFLALGAGIDILADFFIDRRYKNTIGLFVGVGFGAFGYFDFDNPIIIANEDPKKYVFSANLTIQGGFSFSFAYRHRMEVGIRFLPTQSLTLQEDGIQADYGLYIGYSYKFKTKASLEF